MTVSVWEEVSVMTVSVSEEVSVKTVSVSDEGGWKGSSVLSVMTESVSGPEGSSLFWR
jgi:hypothetical protein